MPAKLSKNQMRALQTLVDNGGACGWWLSDRRSLNGLVTRGLAVDLQDGTGRYAITGEGRQAVAENKPARE